MMMAYELANESILFKVALLLNLCLKRRRLTTLYENILSTLYYYEHYCEILENLQQTFENIPKNTLQKKMTKINETNFRIMKINKKKRLWIR